MTEGLSRSEARFVTVLLYVCLSLMTISVATVGKVQYDLWQDQKILTKTHADFQLTVTDQYLKKADYRSDIKDIKDMFCKIQDMLVLHVTTEQGRDRNK